MLFGSLEYDPWKLITKPLAKKKKAHSDDETLLTLASGVAAMPKWDLFAVFHLCCFRMSLTCFGTPLVAQEKQL